MRHEVLTLHGHRFAYREAGEPGLPVVLLVHGITSSSATWDRIIPALAAHAHVIAPDLPGHGDSDKPRGDYSLGAFASALRDLLEHLDLEHRRLGAADRGPLALRGAPLRARPAVVCVVGLDDPLHELVTDHVLPSEADELDPLDGLEHVADDDQP